MGADVVPFKDKVKAVEVDADEGMEDHSDSEDEDEEGE